MNEEGEGEGVGEEGGGNGSSGGEVGGRRGWKLVTCSRLVFKKAVQGLLAMCVFTASIYWLLRWSVGSRLVSISSVGYTTPCLSLCRHTHSSF